MTGPVDDPRDRPTRMTEIADSGSQVLELEPTAPATDDAAPQPWYRNRMLLALWALMVALLLTLIVYGIVELSRGGGDTTGPATTTSTSSTTTPTRSSTTSPTTTRETTSEDTPPPESPQQTPEEAPPPANDSPTPATPPHHHHHWHLPHVF